MTMVQNCRSRTSSSLLFFDDFEGPQTTAPDLGNDLWDPVGDFWFLSGTGVARQNGGNSANVSSALVAQTWPDEYGLRIESVFGGRSNNNSMQGIVVNANADGTSGVVIGRWWRGSRGVWETRIMAATIDGSNMLLAQGPDLTSVSDTLWAVSVDAGGIRAVRDGDLIMEVSEPVYEVGTHVGMWGYGAFFHSFAVYPLGS